MENNKIPSHIDHLVIIVSDVGKTADFYGKFLGKPVQFNEEKVVYQVGDTRIYFRVPFKEWERRDKDRSGLNHLAFGMKSIEELKNFGRILDTAGIKNSGFKVSKMGKDFIWFDDPDGYRLEFYYNPEYLK